MNDLWINIRFGYRHLQIGPRGPRISASQYHYEQLRIDPKWPWFEVYDFFGWSK